MNNYKHYLACLTLSALAITPAMLRAGDEPQHALQCARAAEAVEAAHTAFQQARERLLAQKISPEELRARATAETLGRDPINTPSGTLGRGAAAQADRLQAQREFETEQLRQAVQLALQEWQEAQNELAALHCP